MLGTRRRLASTALAVAMFVGLTSCGGSLHAADSEYEETVAALKNAGAEFQYSDENPQAPDGGKTVTAVIFRFRTKDAFDTAMESLHHVRALPHLEDVALGFDAFNPADSTKLLDHLTRHADALSKLKSFSIRTHSDAPVTDAEICDLSKVPMLSHLAIAPSKAVDVTDKALACLKRPRGLRALILYNTRITDEGLAHLSGKKHLEYLAVRGTEISGEGLRHLTDVPLRRLRLVETNIDYENLKWLSGLEKLEHLSLGACPIDGADLQYLSRLKGLQSLALLQTQIDDKALLHLQQFPKLKELVLYKCPITDASVPALTKLKGLTHLDVRKTKLSDAGRKRLHEALPDTRIQ